MSNRRWFFSMAGRGMAAAFVAPAVLIEQAQATTVTINTLRCSPSRQFVDRKIDDRMWAAQCHLMDVLIEHDEIPPAKLTYIISLISERRLREAQAEINRAIAEA